MVRSSYKKHKKNQKQSFKRRVTGGNRKVKFIEDHDDNKMVGGNKDEVAKLITKYKHYPLSGLILAAFSNATCASESECEPTAVDRKNLSSLQNSVNKCETILNALPNVAGKPNVKTWEKNKDSDFIAYLDDCIGYIIKNVFIPKDLIQNVYVQNDDGTNWTTLTNSNFKKDKSPETTTDRDAKSEANEKMKSAATESEGTDDGPYNPTEQQQQDRIALNKQITTPTAGAGESLEDKFNEPYFKNQARQVEEATEQARIAAEKRGTVQAQIPIN